MTKWEYHKTSSTVSTTELDRLGLLGWEIAAANKYFIYLKRPIPHVIYITGVNNG